MTAKSGRADTQPDGQVVLFDAPQTGRSRDSEAERTASERPLTGRGATRPPSDKPRRLGAPGPMEPMWCDHTWRFHRVSRVPLGKCLRPTVLACVMCEKTMKVRCDATREDRCEDCGRRHRRRVARVMRSGFNGDRPEGFFFATLTAPGVGGGMLWDPSCGHGEGECSGELGCKVDPLIAAEWNGRAPKRWNEFMTELRRQVPHGVQFCGVWEEQKRGLLHRHALLWAPGVSLQRMQELVKSCALSYGFGPKSDVQAISGRDAREQARRAGYCAAYVTKGSERLVTLSPTTGELRRGGYRPWSASRQWGDTMKAVRAEQRAWVVERLAADVAPPPAGPGGAAALDPDTEIYATAPLPEHVEGCP